MGLFGLPGVCTPLVCARLSERLQSNYRIQRAIGKYALSFAGLKCAISLNLTLDLKEDFVVPAADTKLKVSVHKSSPGAIITSIVMLHCLLFGLLCSDLVNKHTSAVRCWYSIVGANAGSAVSSWKQMKCVFAV